MNERILKYRSPLYNARMARPMPTELNELLRRVSRSFYLTIRALPAGIRSQIGIAYLLARATDTIADTRIVPIHRRKAALQELREAIITAAEGRSGPAPDFGEMTAAIGAAAGQASPAECRLLADFGTVLAQLRGFSEDDRRRIGDVLLTITGGQELDLDRFGNASEHEIGALQTSAELDDYTYRVAGCVGEFWTRMCRAHLFPAASLDDDLLVRNGIRFGKGLQFVNILRDLPKDLHSGRCYIPAGELAGHGLRPAMLLEPACIGRFRPLYDGLLRQAEDHLAAGWSYIQMLPVNQARVRLACSWPILIGIRTVAGLRTGNVLDDRRRIKVSRAEVRGLVLRSLMFYPVPPAWNGLFQRAREAEFRRLTPS